jgi:LmbE family N-acetylglucosaminyl deacetylase
MLELQLTPPGKRRPLQVLCLGAHCDDIDIGCGGTLLKLLDSPRRVAVTWVSFSAPALDRELRRARALSRRRNRGSC